MRTEKLSMPELPPTLNEIIGVARRNHFASAALKKRWHKKIIPFAQKVNPIHGNIYMECVWIVKNRRRDPDNICAATKYIFDVLVQCGKIDDDSMKVIQSPVVNHFVVGENDAFTIYIRDEEAFTERLKTNIIFLPIDYAQGTSIQPTKRKSKRKSNR